MSYSIELGPIRPPSEATSILLRLTRNCPWNQCVFCPTFKDKKFSMRTVEEVKSDIDAIHRVLEELHKKAGKFGKLTNQHADDVASEIGISGDYVQQILYWAHFGMTSLFLQDADSLTMKTPEILEILNYIKLKLPMVERITTYARANTVSRKSMEELIALREAGLNRLHIGMESGSDEVLALIKKGVTSEKQIDGGRKGVEAGFEVSLYFMPGCGGLGHLENNALGSAKVINAVNPAFIRIRSTVPMPGTPLYQMMLDGTWSPLSERDKVRELRMLIENLDGIKSVLMSDHIMNLLEEVEGKFPEDKSKMLAVIDRFFSLTEAEQDNYMIGRRLGYYRKLSDNRGSQEMENIKAQLITQYGNLEAAMLALLTRYI